MVEMLSNNNSEQLNVSKETYDKVAENFDWKNTNEELANVLALKLMESLNISENSNEKNAFDKICSNDTLNKYDTLNKLSNYSDIKKAQVANELSMLMQITEDPLWTIQKKLNKWASITPETFWVTCWDDVQNLLEQAQSLQKEKAIDLYKKFGGNIENYPNFVNLATWDGSSTNWEQWVSNVWRIFWSYPVLKDTEEKNEDKFDKSVNYFTFSDKTKEASILIEPTWIDGDWWGNIKLKLIDTDNWTEYFKTCLYTEKGLSFDKKDNLPDDVTFNAWIIDKIANKRGCVIKIPKDYSNYDIQIETSSNVLKSHYDEIKFCCRIINWEIASTKKLREPFETGSYKLSESNTNQLLKHIKMMNIDNINDSLTLWVNIDNKWFYYKEIDAQQELHKFQSAEKKLIELLKNKWIEDSKIENIIKDYSKKIDNEFNKTKWVNKSWKEQNMSENNLALQKQLAINRFLESFNVLLDDEKFKEAVQKWKKIIPRIRVTDNDRSIVIS